MKTEQNDVYLSLFPQEVPNFLRRGIHGASQCNSLESKEESSRKQSKTTGPSGQEGKPNTLPHSTTSLPGVSVHRARICFAACGAVWEGCRRKSTHLQCRCSAHLSQSPAGPGCAFLEPAPFQQWHLSPAPCLRETRSSSC